MLPSSNLSSISANVPSLNSPPFADNPYILPLVTLVPSVIGTEDKPDFNSTVALPSAINETAVFIRGEYAFRGRPLWPFVPS